MATQDYSNHAHRPRLWVVGTLAWLLAACLYVVTWTWMDLRVAAEIALLVAVLAALLIGRVYITALQDRIIRAEMRARCAALLPPEATARFDELAIKQVTALRFASDRELPALYERALRERLTPDAIKRAVQEWVGDYYRT